MDIRREMKFEIHRSKRNGQYRAYILGLNGEKVFTSEQYKTWQKAEKAIRLVRWGATIDVFDKDGNWTKTVKPEEGMSPGVSSAIA